MGDINHEPSMEEILASIKRIIAEDGDAAHSNAPGIAEAEADSGPRADVDAEPANETPAADVLELTETIEAQPEPAPVAESEEPLIAAEAAQSSRTALAALAAISSHGDPQNQAANSQALEDMVREMLRPMLKDWLDDNLPAIIESMVAKEIARIAGKDD